jgi:ribosomal protein S18 acetylase RimI-like enzyme
VNVSDWRFLPAETTTRLYRRERIRWRRRLCWETAATWSTVETARTTWGLPGLVCRDHAGAIRGWTFYLPRDGRLDVGGLVADHPAATAALFDALQERASAGRGLSGFLYPDAAGLDAAIAARRLAARPFLYLVRRLEEPLPPAELSGADSWNGDDRERAARLLQRAYGEAGRIFAPRNRLEDWGEYVNNLIRDPACGVFSASLSRALPLDGGLGALAIVTAIGPHTAHLAQIAVDPSLQRRGVARRLLTEVIADARRAGFARLSLLVGADNLRARELYRGLRFTLRERFVAVESSIT